MTPVFDYPDYKGYLRTLVAERGRGEKSRLAEALRCHLAYVSQVLGGDAQFSPEQADLMSHYLAHSEDEAEFFLTLVLRDRAGSASLRERYEARIKHVLNERVKLENRLRNKKTLPAENQAVYYSAWYFSAIHLLITIPAYQTKEAIARHLALPLPLVSRVLDFLTETGLATLSGGRYRSGQVLLHLQNNSPWLARHHASWRIQATRSIERQSDSDFHYTSVVSMSEEDAGRARKILLDAIEQVRAVVKASPEEAAYCYAVDLFGT